MAALDFYHIAEVGHGIHGAMQAKHIGWNQVLQRDLAEIRDHVQLCTRGCAGEIVSSTASAIEQELGSVSLLGVAGEKQRRIGVALREIFGSATTIAGRKGDFLDFMQLGKAKVSRLVL